MHSRRRLIHADRSSLRNSRLLGFALVISFVALAAVGPPAANAYLYWANGGTNSIGRADLHGSGANQNFIIGANGPSGVAVDPGHVYWANDGTGKIGRANLKGSGITQSFITTGSSFLRGLAVDAGHVYWASSSTIGRANLDGTGADQNFITGAGGPYGVAVDAGHIYWANHTANTVGRANLNGTGANPSFITGAGGPYGVAVDAGHVYWTNFSTSKIGRANLDGTGVNQSFISGAASSPWGVAVDAGHVYWANFSTIGRARLDGTGADQNFITGASGVTGVAVDGLAPPNTRIKSAAVNRAKRKASFRFSSSQPGSTFICSLDGKALRSCKSPKTYKHLKKGNHTFRVMARNSQGASDPSPGKRSFTI
jgi:virginiamycin B lyase